MWWVLSFGWTLPPASPGGHAHGRMGQLCLQARPCHLTSEVMTLELLEWRFRDGYGLSMEQELRLNRSECSLALCCQWEKAHGGEGCVLALSKSNLTTTTTQQYAENPFPSAISFQFLEEIFLLGWIACHGCRFWASATKGLHQYVSSCRQWFGTRGFNIVPVVPRIKLQTSSLSAYHHWTTRSFDIGWKPRRPSQFQWTTYYMNQTRHVSKKPLKKGTSFLEII